MLSRDPGFCPWVYTTWLESGLILVRLLSRDNRDVGVVRCIRAVTREKRLISKGISWPDYLFPIARFWDDNTPW